MSPAGNARRLFAIERKRPGFKRGYLTGDGLYAKAAATTFQIPAREAGYKLLLPIVEGTSGVQGSHPSGMVLVDGSYYCPAISPELRTVIDDYRAKRITHEVFVARIKARKKFEMVTKQSANHDGVGELLGCRAANHSLTVTCANKPDSEAERLSLDRDGNLADNRPPIDLSKTTLREHPPTICRVQAVTMKPTDGAKFRQAIPFGTDEHIDVYNRLRQSQEGMHGFVKDEAQEALGNPGRRRFRTKVAQQLIAAFLLAAANLRKIRSFLEKALEDASGDLYVVRTVRKGKHRRTGNPPGHAPPAEEPAA